MDKVKRKRLEEKGWKVGNAFQFLDLTNEEATYIELKMALNHTVKERRLQKNLTQVELAKLLKSSQSRVGRCISRSCTRKPYVI